MDVVVRDHKSLNELPSPSFALRAYELTSAGSGIAKYALDSIYFVLHQGDKRMEYDEKNETDWSSEDLNRVLITEVLLSTILSFSAIKMGRIRGGSMVGACIIVMGPGLRARRAEC